MLTNELRTRIKAGDLVTLTTRDKVPYLLDEKGKVIQQFHYNKWDGVSSRLEHLRRILRPLNDGMWTVEGPQLFQLGVYNHREDSFRAMDDPDWRKWAWDVGGAQCMDERETLRYIALPAKLCSRFVYYDTPEMKHLDRRWLLGPYTMEFFRRDFANGTDNFTPMKHLTEEEREEVLRYVLKAFPDLKDHSTLP